MIILDSSLDKPRKTGSELRIVRESARKKGSSCQEMSEHSTPRPPAPVQTYDQACSELVVGIRTPLLDLCLSKNKLAEWHQRHWSLLVYGNILIWSLHFFMVLPLCLPHPPEFSISEFSCTDLICDSFLPL